MTTQFLKIDYFGLRILLWIRTNTNLFQRRGWIRAIYKILLVPLQYLVLFAKAVGGRNSNPCSRGGFFSPHMH